MHLKFIDEKLDSNLLKKFKRANAGRYEWDDDIKATILFNMWIQIVNDINKEQKNIEPTTQIAISASDISDIPLNTNYSELLITNKYTTVKFKMNH